MSVPRLRALGELAVVALVGGVLVALCELSEVGRLGSSMLVPEFLHLKRLVSVRSFGRVERRVSANGLARFGSVLTMSVLDLVPFGAWGAELR